MAWVTTPALIGPVLGPPVGGFITTYATWHWIFIINVPIGLLGIALATRYIPDVRRKIDYVEASTPRTFQHYTRHLQGASFGTKFEGLKVSRDLPQQVPGLYHAGSVGIIMSGWLGAVNYGVIVANDVDKFLTTPNA